MNIFHHIPAVVRIYIGLLCSLLIPYIILLLRLPILFLQLFAVIWLLIMLKEIISYIRKTIPQHIPIIIGMIIFLTIGFSFYFKLDRDYAAYISNAYYLIQNGGFFAEAIYPERLLSIVNGVYTPSFLIGYSLYLAVFVSILGNWGLIVANSMALIIGFICIEQLYRLITKTDKSPRLLSIFFLANPVIYWLYSYTYSEALFLPIIWGAIMSFILGLQSKHIGLIFLAFWGIIISFMVRVEGLGLILTFGTALVAACMLIPSHWKQKTVYSAISIVILIGILGGTLVVSGEYILAQFQDASRTIDLQDKDNTLSDTKERFQLLLLSFGTYLVMIPLLWSIANRKLYTNKYVYWIIFLLLPFTIYLYNPRITRDFPWLLRRYSTAIIPLVLLFGTWGMTHIYRGKKYISSIIIGLYILAQILFIGLLIRDRVDQRSYYDELSQFFASQELPKDTIVYMRGDFDRVNEVTRIIPYLQASQDEIIFRSTYLDEVFKTGGYLVDTV
ncbi:MAG: hypothetical protein RJB24_489, partial [Candidatus Parcubacteria bacterium]